MHDICVASDRSSRKLQTSTCRGKTTLIIHDILVLQSMITACGSSEDTYFSMSYRASWRSQVLPRRETEKVVLPRTRQYVWGGVYSATKTEPFGILLVSVTAWCSATDGSQQSTMNCLSNVISTRCQTQYFLISEHFSYGASDQHSEVNQICRNHTLVTRMQVLYTRH
jgi:hypothetical protein